MNEKEIASVLQYDFSAGTQEFRDALLERCLAVLQTLDAVEIDAESLDMLAAAGEQGLVAGMPETGLQGCGPAASRLETSL